MNAPATAAALTVACAGAVYRITPDHAPATIGRSPEADVPVADPRVSRAHVHLEVDRGAWRAVDADSRNGMFVDGQRRTVVSVYDGLVIHVGDPDGTPLTFGFARDHPDAPDSDDETVDPEIARVGAA